MRTDAARLSRSCDAYTKRFGEPPPYTGFTTYDAVNVVAEAIKRAGSTDPDKLVEALEKTDYVGTIGRVAVLRHATARSPTP